MQFSWVVVFLVKVPGNPKTVLLFDQVKCTAKEEISKTKYVCTTNELT